MQGTCSIENCPRPARTRGWCHTHYVRWLKHGTTDLVSFKKIHCSVGDCELPHVARGMCSVHYARWRRLTNPPERQCSAEHGSYTRYQVGCRCDACRTARREAGWKSQYKLTPDQYFAMLDAQGGVCAICATPPGRRWLEVDHDHACCSGQTSCGRCVRGLLCPKCNSRVAAFENPDGPHQKIAAYLKARAG